MKNYFIWGMGLLGTSIALALRQKGHHIYGCTDQKKDIPLLNGLDFHDVLLNTDISIENVIANCNAIIIATPINEVYSVLEILASMKLGQNAWITDMASSKVSLMKWLETNDLNLPFVGSHPMAGSDLSGPQNASHDIFKGATIYIVQSQFLKNKLGEEHYESITNRVEHMWQDIKAYPHRLSSEKHDRWVAYLSHGLHLISCASSILIEDIPEVFEVSSRPSGGSFRDMSRVSGSNPKLWEGIIKANSAEIKNYLNRFSSLIQEWASKLEHPELSVQEIFEEAQRVKQRVTREDI